MLFCAFLVSIAGLQGYGSGAASYKTERITPIPTPALATSAPAFTCNNGNELGLKTMLCDGLDQCGDGSDEEIETCRSACTGGDVIFCPASARCHGMEEACVRSYPEPRGLKFCPSIDQEVLNSRCDHVCTFISGFSLCEGAEPKTCIRDSMKCDGNQDCPHGEDEENCD